MFTDSVVITVRSGHGGAGGVAFHREKFIIQGGPSGGDGGDGGSVFFSVDMNADSLTNFRGRHLFAAKNGESGKNKNKHGKKGEDILLSVPVGTQVLDYETNELILDLTEVCEKKLFFAGGKGGLGNTHFKSPANQRPTYAQKGLPGVEKKIKLVLKLIADVGLVGFPNVGKSTLISVISDAKPEIANYEFTTLKPNLGVVNMENFGSFVVADIPGIIEGASSGKGLGLEFLKHIERTKILLFMLDNTRDIAPTEQLKMLKKELKIYSSELSKRLFAVAITKCDTFEKESVNAVISEFCKKNRFSGIKLSSDDYKYFSQSEEAYDAKKPAFVLPISSAANINISFLKQQLFELVTKQKKSL